MVVASCDLKAPRCPTTAPQVCLHGPRGVSSLVTAPRDPGDSLLHCTIYNIIKWWSALPRSFTSIQTFHTRTHTHTLQRRVWEAHEMKMRMTRNEGEVGMKMRWGLLNRNPGRGTQKKRGGTKRKHQHQHTWSGAGEPWKGKGKEKAEAYVNKPRPAEGGKDGRA